MTVTGEQRPAPLDRDALATVFDAHSQDVFRYLARRCEDRALAEDLMSVAFLEAWRARDRAVLVDGTRRLRLLGIAANVRRNSRRSLRRHRSALDRYRATAGLLVQPDHAYADADRADAPGVRRQLDAAFAALSAKDRQSRRPVSGPGAHTGAGRRRARAACRAGEVPARARPWPAPRRPSHQLG